MNLTLRQLHLFTALARFKSITAVARHCRERGKKLRVLWLDAHADFNTAALTPSGNLHGMPVALLCGLGPPELTGIGGHVPAVQPAQIRQIGIRSVDAGEKQLIKEHGLAEQVPRFVIAPQERADLDRLLRLADTAEDRLERDLARAQHTQRAPVDRRRDRVQRRG